MNNIHIANTVVGTILSGEGMLVARPETRNGINESADEPV